MFRFIKGIFKFIFNGFLFLFLLIFVAIFWQRARTKTVIKENTYLVLRLNNSFFKEYEVQNIFGAQASFRTIRNVMNESKNDSHIKGMIIEVQGNDIRHAQAAELHRLIKEYRQAGKQVYVYADSFGINKNTTALYYGLSSASEIWMQRCGVVNLLGIGIESPFFRSFLDKHKIKYYVERRKEYKGAMEAVMFNDFTPQVKENLETVFHDILDIMVDDISKARNIKPEDMGNYINMAPLADDEALSVKLIDKISDRNEFYKHIKTTHQDPKLITFEKYHCTPFSPKKPHVAVIYLNGAIMHGFEGGFMPYQEVITHTVFNKMVEKAIKNDAKAIVIRMNSPGGQPEAAESMRSALAHAKSKGIKIYASFGDFAASAGYYIPTICDKIFTEKTTLTGSIGIYEGKLFTEDAWNEYGVFWRRLAIGKNATMFSTGVEMTDEQKLIFNKIIDKWYIRFIKLVEEYAKRQGRSFTEEQARGKVYSGKAAIEIGLAEEGGLLDAIRYATKEANLSEGAKIEYPYGGLIELILNTREEGLKMLFKGMFDFGSQFFASPKTQMADPAFSRGRIQ